MRLRRFEQPAGLIALLLDKTRLIDDRAEAAEDLAEFDEPEALEALLQVALDKSEDEFVLEPCGESIAETWNRRRSADRDVLDRLAPVAKAELLLILDKSLVSDPD